MNVRTHKCIIVVVLTLCGLCCMTASLPMLGPPLKQTTIFSSNTAYISVNRKDYDVVSISFNITITIITKITNNSKFGYS